MNLLLMTAERASSVCTHAAKGSIDGPVHSDTFKTMLTLHTYIVHLILRTGQLMIRWRLLKLESHDAFLNMAIDEAILEARIRDRVPNTLRLYRWNPSAVSIGRFQSIWREVNLRECVVSGVDVVRRISGGGAVYHDSEYEVTYSVVMKRGDLDAGDVLQVYYYICNGLIKAARIVGVNAEYERGDARHCPNITVNGRKISGNAQANRKDSILQHGTLLVNVDFSKMFTFLKIPRKASCMDFQRTAKSKIGSLVSELGRSLSISQVSEAIRLGFEEALGIELVEGVLTDYEATLAQELERTKFVTPTWNFEGRSDSLSLEPVS